MLAPALLFLAVMIAYPLGKVIHDAFSQVNLIKPNVSGFAGLDNFKTILNDEHFWNDAKNTVIWTVCSVAGEYIVGSCSAESEIQGPRDFPNLRLYSLAGSDHRCRHDMGLDAQYRFRHCKLPVDSSAYRPGSDKLPR